MANERVVLYPLTQADLYAAEERGGLTEHVQMHDLACTEVWVNADGQACALYEYWLWGEDQQVEWAKLWLTVRDGVVIGEY